MSQTGQEYYFVEGILQCLICKHTLFEQEKALLHSQGDLHAEEQAEVAVDTYICTNCGYILWFVAIKISQPGQGYLLDDQPLYCAMCKGQTFVAYETPLKTRSATFMQFNWIKPVADNYSCTHCGFIQWRLTVEVGRPGQSYEINGRKLRCQHCSQRTFRERESLIHSKGTIVQGSAWTNQQAKNYTCTACGLAQWFI